MPQSELDQVDRYEVNALADRLLLMFRDIEDEDKRFFPSLRAVYDKLKRIPGGGRRNRRAFEPGRWLTGYPLRI